MASTASALPDPVDLDYRFDPAQVLGQRLAADLHLDDGVAHIQVAAHLILECAEVLAGLVVAAGGVDPDPLVGLAAAVAIGQQPIERLLLDLGDRVPDRHVDRADRDRAFAVTARFLAGHHHGPDLVRIEIGPIVGQQSRPDRLHGGGG